MRIEITLPEMKDQMIRLGDTIKDQMLVDHMNDIVRKVKDKALRQVEELFAGVSIKAHRDYECPNVKIIMEAPDKVD